MIASNETKIIGKWIYDNNKIVESESVKRINYLKKNYLIEIARSNSGWEILFQDPNDKRYWELTYLENELHGGGPPSLILLSKSQVQDKYGNVSDVLI